MSATAFASGSMFPHIGSLFRMAKSWNLLMVEFRQDQLSKILRVDSDTQVDSKPKILKLLIKVIVDFFTLFYHSV